MGVDNYTVGFVVLWHCSDVSEYIDRDGVDNWLVELGIIARNSDEWMVKYILAFLKSNLNWVFSHLLPTHGGRGGDEIHLCVLISVDIALTSAIKLQLNHGEPSVS